jgi:hypothetical protein
MANPGIIENEDWNAIQTTIARVLGTPDATTLDLGYNIPGSITSVQVVNNAKIFGADWNTLRTDVNIAIKNQTSANTALVTKGNTDIIFSSDFTLLSGFIATANTNRGNVTDSELTSQNGPDKSFTGTWASSTVFEGRINFGSNARFRGFWNAGGKIVFNASRSGGSTNNQNTSWTNLLSSLGSVVLRRTSMTQTGQTATGTYSNSGNLGVYGSGIGTGYTTVFTLEDSSNATPSYRPNDYRIDLRYDAANKLSATYIDFRIVLSDDHLPIGAGPDFIDGTLSLNCDIFYPFSNSATAVSEITSSQT